MVRFYLAVIMVMSALLLLVMAIIESPLVRPRVRLGQLVFTDYPKPDRHFTVDMVDLEIGRRTSLPQEPYDDIGFLSAIDTQRVYGSLCFARNISGFCLSPVNTTIPPKNLAQLATIRQLWKGNYGPPVWSPDGTHIAFSVVDKGTQRASLASGDTYVMNADGTHIVDLTPTENINGYDFVWSPDSKHIAFACSNARYLCMSQTDGNHLQEWTMPLYMTVHEMAWSPDASQLVFSLMASDYHNAALYLVNADGSHLHRLLETETAHYGEPKWSPDGSKIVFTNKEGGNQDLYIISPDGTDLQHLSQGLGGLDFGAIWSLDSTKVAFFSWQLQKGVIFLYAADITRGLRQKITNHLSLGMTDAVMPELFWLP